MAKTEEATVTLRTDDDEVTVPLETFERVTHSFQQLTFDVGGDHPRPTGGSLKITGSGDLRSQLYMDDDVTVQVVDARGEVVATFDGRCVNVAFKKHKETKESPPWVERIHTINLGAE